MTGGYIRGAGGATGPAATGVAQSKAPQIKNVGGGLNSNK